jgi:Fe-S-cluster containining protein
MGNASASDEELIRGFLYSHHRANANTAEIHQANATVRVLTEQLLERGLLDADKLKQRFTEEADRLRQNYIERGMAVTTQESPTSKYAFEDGPKIDCENRVHLCKAACCRLEFALSKEDVQEHIVRWDLGRPYMIARDHKDGYCVHLERPTCCCSIYNNRPLACRGYDCRNDKRIWLDFANKVVNPQLDHPQWPNCVESSTDAASLRQSDEEQSRPDPPPRSNQPTHVEERRGQLVVRQRRPMLDQFRPNPNAPPVAAPAFVETEQPATHRDTQAQPAARRIISLSTTGVFDPLRQRFNSGLDKLVRPFVSVFGFPWPAYRAFVYLGVICGGTLSVLVAGQLGLSMLVITTAVVVSVLAAIGLGLISKILTGEENFTFYHYELAVFLVSAVRTIGEYVIVPNMLTRASRRVSWECVYYLFRRSNRFHCSAWLASELSSLGRALQAPR